MNQNATLDVIDREGWRKELPLQRTIVHIGSDPRSDIVLESARGAGVSPLHAQLIAANSGLGYQLVNLGDADILLGPSGDQVLPPRSVTHLVDGLLFKLGEFTLIFHCGDEGPSESFPGESRFVGLKLSLAQTRLAPKRSLEGRVTVSNLGDRSGVQFNLELEGLESDCFDIEPGPILAAGAAKEVSFRLYHRGDKPLAGDRRIVIRATAPNAYPGEEMVVSQVIEILPLYRHSLRLISPDKVVEPAPQAEERPAATQVAPPPAAATEPSPQAEDWWTASPAKAMEPKTRVSAASPQAAAPPRPTRPAAEVKPSVVESPVPAAPAAEPEPAGEAAPAPVAEAALAAPASPAAEPEPAAEVTPPLAEAVPPRAEAAPLPAVEEATPLAEEALPVIAIEQAEPAKPAEQAPPAEPAAAPPKKGWARLIQAIPFLRPRQVAPPPGSAVAVVQPQAAPAIAEASPLPVLESAPVEVEEEETAAAGIVREPETPETVLPPQPQESLVEVETSVPAPDEDETTPAAEPIIPAPVQEQWAPETGPGPLPPSGEELAAPPEAEGHQPPEVTPQVEEEGPLSVEVAPEEAPKRPQAMRMKASPPPETEEVWAPPVAAGPAPAEDWWAVEAASKETETRPVLKLKASLPAEEEPKRASVEAEPPPPAEDWWTAEAGADAEAPVEKRQVLKLKASLPPEEEAEQTPVEGEPPPAEDWWTA